MQTAPQPPPSPRRCTQGGPSDQSISFQDLDPQEQVGLLQPHPQPRRLPAGRRLNGLRPALPCPQARVLSFCKTFLGSSSVAKEAVTLSDPQVVWLAALELLACVGGAARSDAAAARTTSFADIKDRGGPEHVGVCVYIGEMVLTGQLDTLEQLEQAMYRLYAAWGLNLISASVCKNAITIVNLLFHMRVDNPAAAELLAIHYVGMVSKPTKPTAKRWSEHAAALSGTQIHPFSCAFPGRTWKWKVAITDTDFFRVFNKIRALAADLGVDCLDMTQLVLLGEALLEHFMRSLMRDGGGNVMSCGAAIFSGSSASPAHISITSRVKSNWVALELAQRPGADREELWQEAGQQPLQLLLAPDSTLLDLADELAEEGKLPGGRAAPINMFLSAINSVYSALGCARPGAACPLRVGVCSPQACLTGQRRAVVVGVLCCCAAAGAAGGAAGLGP
jgi:hypothetical protein